MWRDAGVVALLFGGGADGTTCACDAQGDGVTNPAAINGNTRLSLSADDDGGFFHERAAAYYASGGWTWASAAPPPPVAPRHPRSPGPQRDRVASPSGARRHTETITVSVRASAATRAKVDIRIYDPKGIQVFRKVYDNAAFAAGVTRAFRPTWYISATRRLGTYSVRIRI